MRWSSWQWAAEWGQSACRSSVDQEMDRQTSALYEIANGTWGTNINAPAAQAQEAVALGSEPLGEARAQPVEERAEVGAAAVTGRQAAARQADAERVQHKKQQDALERLQVWGTPQAVGCWAAAAQAL